MGVARENNAVTSEMKECQQERLRVCGIVTLYQVFVVF